MPFHHLPEKIRVIRRFLHLTQQDMAERLNISAEAYGKIERGKTRIHLERLKQVSAIFGVDTTQIVEHSADEVVQALLQQPMKNPE